MSATLRIPVGGDLSALVDAADAHLVEGKRWRPATPKGRTYARSGNLLMHRVILGAAYGQMVDHIDGDGLNNTRANLRFCNHSENAANAFRKPSSGFKGVFLDKKRGLWRARIWKDYRPIDLGAHATPELAAKAYDIAARQIFGTFAHLNMPDTQRRTG